MNFCGFFDVYNLHITQEKNFFEKFFHFYLTYLRDNFEKILKIFFQARGLRLVANDEEFCTLSCAGVSSRLIEYFFSYFDLKIPIFQGVCQKLSIPPIDSKISKNRPLTYLRIVIKFQTNQKNFQKKFQKKWRVRPNLPH